MLSALAGCTDKPSVHEGYYRGRRMLAVNVASICLCEAVVATETAPGGCACWAVVPNPTNPAASQGLPATPSSQQLCLACGKQCSRAVVDRMCNVGV